MSHLVLHPTSEAQWHALVTEAAHSVNCKLDEDMESYLVFLLMRFATRPEMAERVMALDYLESMQMTGDKRFDQLRDVGDQCLLYSGLFPARSLRKRVSVTYYVDLGRSAYQQLAEILQHSLAQLYGQIAHGFIHMMDVLHAMRDMDQQNRLQPVLAWDLWQVTGSRYAEKIIRETAGKEVFTGIPSRFSH